MAAVSQILINKYGFKGEMGLVLLKSKKGLGIIESLSKYEKFWKTFADLGMVLSYGALSWFFMKRKLDWKIILFGFILLAALAFVIAPLALTYISTVIKGGSITPTSNAAPGLSAVAIVYILLLFAGGMFAVMLASILLYGVSILQALISTLIYGTGAIYSTKPGATLLLPGINLPLLEGILALFVILVVHEACHAILARIAKIKVLSSGIVLFGIIPIGAFVEPDEQELKKTEDIKQSRVIVAGSTANLISCILFFILFLGFFSVTGNYREQGLWVISGLGDKDTVIYQIDQTKIDIDKIDIKNLNLNLPKSSDVTLYTNKGTIVKKTDENGKLGVNLILLTKDSLFGLYNNIFLQAIYTFLGLCFALNFVIGSVNILPVPLFDGYRIIDINIKHKAIVTGLMYITIAAFLTNILPILFVR
ncbi:MAG: site-2 protease family protein [Candidatus Micrarchaeota archaeon]